MSKEQEILDMKYRVYYLEKRNYLGNEMYVDPRCFLEELAVFDTEKEAIEYCKKEADKIRGLTILPVYGG
jgi:hypothetical protein